MIKTNHKFIIFLDVDGVMNSEIYYSNSENNTRLIELPIPDYNFDPRTIDLLNNITDETGAKIVLSASMRKSYTVDELKTIFNRIGITGELIDKTESTNKSWNRGREIHKWIQANRDYLKKDYHQYRSYVILDDDSDMLHIQAENFFHCDSYAGLTPNIAYKIINFFKSFEEPNI